MQTGCDTVQTVLIGVVRSHVPARQAARQSFSFNGELQAGGNSICLCFWSALMTPPEGHPGQLAYTFVICIISTSHTQISTFLVCCYSTYLSLWSEPKHKRITRSVGPIVFELPILSGQASGLNMEDCIQRKVAPLSHIHSNNTTLTSFYPRFY